MAKVKVSSKHQITLPKSAREALGIEAGDELYVVREGDKLVFKTLPKIKEPTKALYGSAKSKKDAVRAIREFRRSGGRAP